MLCMVVMCAMCSNKLFCHLSAAKSVKYRPVYTQNVHLNELKINVGNNMYYYIYSTQNNCCPTRHVPILENIIFTSIAFLILNKTLPSISLHIHLHVMHACMYYNTVNDVVTD